MNNCVFLGGTCKGSLWREEIKPLLKIEYFDPVVADWTPECQAREIQAREESRFCLYTITPKMTGVYSIAEVVDDSNKRPEKTVFVVLKEDDGQEFTPVQWKSLTATGTMVKKNGGQVFTSLSDAAAFFNS